MNFKQFGSFILALAVFTSSAFGEELRTPPDGVEARLSRDNCEGFLGERYDTNLEGLLNGEKVFGEMPNDFHVDDQTASDLELDELATIFEPYLYTDIAKARLRYRLRNWKLSPTEIRRDTAIIQYMVAHPEEFNELRKHLKLVQKSFEKFLEDFKSRKHDQAENFKERLKASSMWFLLLAPTLAKLIAPELGQLFHMAYVGIQAAMGFVFGTVANRHFENVVVEQRKALAKYRDAMVTAKLSNAALDKIQHDMAQELLDNVRVIYEGNADLKTKSYVKLNSYLNHEDKDLATLASFVKGKVDVTKNGLFDINRKLRMMTRPWKLRTQFRKREVEIGVPNFQKIMDNTFITDQNLRSINKQIVDRKEELSELFSALGEIEVLLAVADCYRDNKNTWPISFPDKVLDVDDETELVINDARPPLIAVKDPRGTIANNIRLGNRKNDYAFTMIMGNVGGGRTSFQRTAAQNQALAQNGFFWFASGGYFAAGIVMTSMDLTTNLGSRNYPEYEASRTALALRMANIYPHSYYYADDPFTGGGEIAGINARAATLRGFMHRRTVGMLATRSLGLYLEVKDIDGIEKLYAENRVIGPFKPKEHMQGLRPDDYYNRLADYGMPADVMEDMRLNYKRLADRHLKGALDKPDDQ